MNTQLTEVESLIKIFEKNDYDGSHIVKTMRKLKSMESEITELQKCLEEYLKASTSIYSTSKELGEAETKAIALLEKLKEKSSEKI